MRHALRTAHNAPCNMHYALCTIYYASMHYVLCAMQVCIMYYESIFIRLIMSLYLSFSFGFIQLFFLFFQNFLFVRMNILIISSTGVAPDTNQIIACSPLYSDTSDTVVCGYVIRFCFTSTITVNNGFCRVNHWTGKFPCKFGLNVGFLLHFTGLWGAGRHFEPGLPSGWRESFWKELLNT